MKPFRLLLILLLAGNAPRTAAQTEAAPFHPMRWEKLPDLNIPRAGHQLFLTGGELVVAGGHTEGFIRTPTAEYYAEDTWHNLKTIYPHDNGFFVRLPNGDFLLGGGSAEDFGVGQIYGVERYDPRSHSFSSFPILDIKRALTSAAVLSNGQILVAGNWYADDAIGLSDGQGPFETLLEASQARSYPFIFPCGKEDAVIFSSTSPKGEWQTPAVDRLDGTTYTPELFETWMPANSGYPVPAEACQAVDPESGREAYLFRAFGKDGRQAILCFSEGAFSRIPTDQEIPVAGPWGPIEWLNSVLVDPHRGVALTQGWDNDGRCYLLSVDYLPAFRGETASVCVYYTEPLPERSAAPAVILPDGRFVIAGGHIAHDPMGNYNPLASVYAFSPFSEAAVAAGAFPKWLFLLLALLLPTAAAWMISRRRTPPERDAVSQGTADTRNPENKEKEGELFARVTELMEKEELFRRKGLGVADLATLLGSNTKYISHCVNDRAGCSFNEFLNGYRIRYAQRLLREQPGIRLSEVSEAAGFSSESAFYRNFKVFTDFTPQQWLAREAGPATEKEFP